MISLKKTALVCVLPGVALVGCSTGGNEPVVVTETVVEQADGSTEQSPDPTTESPATESSTTTEATETESTEPEKTTESTSGVHAMTRDDIMSADVPSLCEHPEGTLVGGALPGIPEGQGEVRIQPRHVGVADQSIIAIGDVTGDGVDDAVVQFWCNQGGVAWPNRVVVYSDGKPLTTLDLGSYRTARGPIMSSTIEDGNIRLIGHAYNEGDGSCCPSGMFDVTFGYSNGTFLPLEEFSPGS